MKLKQLLFSSWYTSTLNWYEAALRQRSQYSPQSGSKVISGSIWDDKSTTTH
jgi:hypothetical protein